MLSRGRLGQNGLLSAYNQPPAGPNITNISYADDVLIFTKARKEGLHCLNKILADFEHISGQSVNASKSNFFVHNTAPPAVKHLIRAITCSRTAPFPISRL